MAGAYRAKETCVLLEKLSKLPGPIGELRRLKRNMLLSTIALFLSFISVFFSYIYVAWLRMDLEVNYFYCTMLGNYLL